MASSILITGASGQLGSYLLRELRGSDRRVVAWSGAARGDHLGFPLRPVDLAKGDEVCEAFRDAMPEAIIHTAAVSRIDDCYDDPKRALQVNREGTTLLVELCAQARARMVYVSTDLVFDGQQGWYGEADPPSPLSIYGATKAAPEQSVVEYARGAVLRVSLLFGRSLAPRPAFFDRQLTALREKQSLPLFEDEWRTPLDLITASRALLALADTEIGGVLHLGGPERFSRLEMGQRLARSLSADPSVFRAAKRADVPAPEPRPCDVSLDSRRFRSLFPHLPWPDWDQAIQELGVKV